MPTTTNTELQCQAGEVVDPVARDSRICIAIFSIAAGILILHAWSFLPFISDDALISLRYSQRLLQGFGLTWTDGPRVEGYTNLLWVVACAALGAFHVDLIVASRILGFAGMLAALAAIIYAYRPRNWSRAMGPLAASVGLALTAPIAVWTIGGMEQPFVAAFLAWATTLCLPWIDRNPPAMRLKLPPSICLGLLCLTRADGGVLCIAVAIGLLAARGFRPEAFKQVLLLAIGPLVLGGAQLIFRRIYYHEWLPNPARVKVAFTFEHLKGGFEYVKDAAPFLAPFLLMAILCAILSFRRPALRARTIFLVVTWLVSTGYVVLIGGDIFPAHRHLVPSLILCAFLVAQCGETFDDSIGKRKAIGATAIAMCVILGVIQRLDPKVQLAVQERWEWDGKRVGEMLRRAFGSADPLLACDPAGCIPYFTGFRCIDMMGLNDYHIAHHQSNEFGRGTLGHELGDGKYVLDQKPDLILWSLPTGAILPLFPSAVQMSQDPRFEQHYRLVYFQTPDPNSVLGAIWVRMDSTRISIRTEGNKIVVPGFLAASRPETPAMLDGHGQLGVIARQVPAAHIGGFAPPPGRWRFFVDSDHVHLTVRAPHGHIFQGTREVTVDIARGSALDLDLIPVGQSTVHIREILLTPA